MPIKIYVKKAKKVLNKNWTGKYTVPSIHLYPHQWNWDSGFIAIGYSRYNTKRAIKELTHLFNAQWKNGMVPQIVFNPKKLGSYFPEPDFWRTDLSPNSPKEYLTSGITMPPIHGYAVLKIYQNAKNKENVKQFLEWIYPKLLNLHRYFYDVRNPDGNGLIYIRHPWESGMDNSPTWDEIIERVDLSKVELPKYKRKDIHVVDMEMRPRNKDYDFYIYLLEIFKKHKYDEKEIFKECPFLVYDPLFNSVLSASNHALIEIGDILGKSITEAEEWFLLTKKGISENLYNEESKMFDAYDLKTKKLIKVETAAGFMPLFGGAATISQAKEIYQNLNSKSFCALHQGNCFTIPNYNVEGEKFDRKNYWRGPVWININWMLYKGLKRYGFREKSVQLAKNILELPMRFDFYEYYDSFNGIGYGTKDFSWTAALFIDIAYEGFLGSQPSWKKRIILWERQILNEGIEKAKVPHQNISQMLLLSIKEMEEKLYTEDGVISYEKLKDTPEFKRYKKMAAALQDFDLTTLKNDKEKLAFWINLYNAMVIDGIISLGIKNSINEVGRFFMKVKYKIGGYNFSLNDILNGILRKNKKPAKCLPPPFLFLDSRKRFMVDEVDPRIHFAISCGINACAPIKFYTPEKIDKELDIAAKSFINSSEVIILPEENRIILSEIFKRYEEDFGGLPGILGLIERYLVDDDKKKFLKQRTPDLKISYLNYNYDIWI